MIVITGAAGFIGSNLIRRFNAGERTDLVLVDDFSREDKKPNWQHTGFTEVVERENFLDWLQENPEQVEFVFHLGARTDTTERNPFLLRRLNTDYSKGVWILCARFQIPLVYASSAAVYGAGELGYDDSDELTPRLQPLNPYGWSKLDFDQWVLTPSIPLAKPQEQPQGGGALEKIVTPPFWAGLRFFNVYGHHEQHKGRMASVVYHAARQIHETAKVQLFRSHRPDFADGEQRRDFIHVSDAVDVCLHFLDRRSPSGIYNVGTGQARTFNDLARAVFAALGKAPIIEYIDTPQDIREKYQYFTEAKVDKLRAAGFSRPFLSLEEGVTLTVGSRQ